MLETKFRNTLSEVQGSIASLDSVMVAEIKKRTNEYYLIKTNAISSQNDLQQSMRVLEDRLAQSISAVTEQLIDAKQQILQQGEISLSFEKDKGEMTMQHANIIIELESKIKKLRADVETKLAGLESNSKNMREELMLAAETIANFTKIAQSESTSHEKELRECNRKILQHSEQLNKVNKKIGMHNCDSLQLINTLQECTNALEGKITDINHKHEAGNKYTI